MFRVLSFGLSTSVGSFIRGLQTILRDEILNFACIYVDDMLVVSTTVEQHLRHLRHLFEKLRSAGVTVKLRKCCFDRLSLKFLGHVLTPTGISMDEERIRAIQEFPRPKNIRELRGFLGLVV